MSIYKRPGSETYAYDFQFRNRRFSGNTGCKAKRAAERHVEALRKKLREEAKRPADQLTVHVALGRWWNERGQHLSDGENLLRALEWLKTNIPPSTRMADLGNAMVADLVAQRRGETVRRTNAAGEIEERLVTPATVNRHMTMVLRRIHRRATMIWEVETRKIAWTEHMLSEPQERVREASREEEKAILEAVPEDYVAPIRFALMTGCRRAEIVNLTWTRVDFFNREVRVIGKGAQERTIPMTQYLHELLWSLKDHHETAVFTYRAQRAWQGRERNKRYPITLAGFNTAWRRHGKTAVQNFRLHDTRHTAATRLTRTTGNLKLTQRLLGHASIVTTSRYAHATQEDLRSALEAMSRAASPTQNPTEATEGVAKLRK